MTSMFGSLPFIKMYLQLIKITELPRKPGKKLDFDDLCKKDLENLEF